MPEHLSVDGVKTNAIQTYRLYTKQYERKCRTERKDTDKILYVDAAASREGNGTKEMPFKHINDAATTWAPPAAYQDGMINSFQYSGTMNSTLFEYWFAQQLLPSLEKGTVIVMVNASFHSKKRLISVAQNAGCKLLFLPPYSPELNPIEHFWAWLKRFLRKILPSSASFDDALFTAFQLR